MCTIQKMLSCPFGLWHCASFNLILVKIAKVHIHYFKALIPNTLNTGQIVCYLLKEVNNVCLIEQKKKKKEQLDSTICYA